jgi:hypothetical protein
VYSGIDWDTPFLVRESLLSVGEILLRKKFIMHFVAI